MGIYIEDWFEIRVKEKNHIMSIYVEPVPTNLRAIGFEVFESDGLLTLYWNYGALDKEVAETAKRLRNGNSDNTDLNKKIIESLQSNSIIYQKDLSVDVSKIILELYDTGMEEPESKPSGFGGCLYKMILHGNNERIYDSWYHLPKEWETMYSIILSFIGIAEPEEKLFYIPLK